MFYEKRKLLENLTGVNSSKLNYYVELKSKNEKIVKQNEGLEIINRIVRGVNIDMTIGDIIKRAYSKLSLAIPCDFLGLALLNKDKLYMKAATPLTLNRSNPIPRESFLWECITTRKNEVYAPVHTEDPFITENPELEGKICSLVVAPLFIGATIQGILLIGSKIPFSFSPTESNFVKQLANQLTTCVLNIKLYEQVSRANCEWEATFNALTEPISLIDTHFNVLRNNNHFPIPTDSDFSKGDKERQKCFTLLWGRDERCEECPMDEIIRTGKHVDKRVQKDSGKTFDISYYPVYDELDKFAGIINYIKNVTDKIKMEAQLIQTAKLAAVGEMAAGMAHELNNPMTAIVGTSQLMKRERKGENGESELLNDIILSGLRCKKIIQNLLTFSRQDKYPFAIIDLNKEIAGALDMIRYQIDRSEIELIEKLLPNVPKINANGHGLQQVLVNLLINARDALDGVKREKKIEVSNSVCGDGNGEKWVIITVRDTGIGIAPKDLPKIFNPFYTSKEAVNGTGLGLSVSLGIVQAHGGTIEVDSVLGEGSSFSVILPVCVDNCLKIFD